MQLLVSVRNGREAAAALEGGAQIIDAKDPAAGALGAVSPAALAEIRAVVPRQVPLSAALGDVAGETDLARCLDRVGSGVDFVKLGFLGIADAGRVERLLAAAVKLAGDRFRVVAVGYADWERTDSLAPSRFVPILRRAGAHGLLIDTAVKDQGRLFDFVPSQALGVIGASLRRQDSLFAIAGSLTAADCAEALEVDADILGVRGAVTDGGRLGEVQAAAVARMVRLLSAALPFPSVNHTSR